MENKIGNIQAVSNETQIGIKSESSPFVAAFYFEDIYDDAAIKKFIKNTERLIRQSREYSTYIKEVRSTYTELNKDNILSNITNADTNLEFHHYPFTLYEIIEIIMLSHVVKNEKFTSFSIAKEIMVLHYKHLIGLVSLSETMHELAHSSNLFLSEKQIFGDYRGFMKIYENVISADLKNKIHNMEELSKAGAPSDFKGLL